MVPTRIQTTYNRVAKVYDFSTRLYPYFGFRFHAYRKMLLAQLRLQPGDHVVDFGCGTGLNFPLIQDLIGPSGRITGVDFSEEMLACAQNRVKKAGWGSLYCNSPEA